MASALGPGRAGSLLGRGKAALRRLPGPVRIVAATALAVVIAVGAIAVVRVVVPRPAPLVDDTAQGGGEVCVPTPDKSADTLSWNTPVGFAQNYFHNRSGDPLTVESVSLIDPHNLILHGAVVYEMVHDRNALGNESAWADEPFGIKLGVWRNHHQAVPGAVIEPAGVRQPLPGRRGNVYQLLVDVSARSPHGAWAAGFRLTYRSRGRTYTVSTYEGYAITANDPAGTTCNGLFQGIQDSWSAARVG
ncbi:MAG TPA: hypothetical protein VGI58_10355 [Streptosporangiaceae bacterium]